MSNYDPAGTAGKETTIPSYFIILGMIAITIVIVVAFAGPVNTSPDQVPPAEKISLDQE